MSAIDIQHLSKQLGDTAVLEDVSLTVQDGSITAILGNSGSGKTTLLRTIAGLERADTGTITIANTLVDGPNAFLRPQHRGIGYLPQDGALFPHLTVASNIGFGLHRRHTERITELLELVDLHGFAHRRPGELSGGQQQRVALARALAIRPRVLLLDEPFSSLDASLRTTLRRDLKRILYAAGSTAIIVTHDQGEALSMADHIALLETGRILDANTPRQLYTTPHTPAAAKHLGDINTLTATVTAGIATCTLGSIPLTNPLPDGPATLLLRPEQIAVHSTPETGTMAAHVADVEYFGHDMTVTLHLDAAPTVGIISRVAWPANLTPSQAVWISIHGTAIAESTS